MSFRTRDRKFLYRLLIKTMRGFVDGMEQYQKKGGQNETDTHK
jgi:hypothetical protein